MSQGGGGYDPWANAPVWFCESKESIWVAGIVKSHEVVNNVRHEWKFTIEKEEKDEKEDEESEAEDTHTTVEVTSEAVDSFNLEFLDVKKRDKSVGHMVQISDMTSLAFLNEPEMIECLRQRFLKEIIYTSIGPILVAVSDGKLRNECDTVFYFYIIYPNYCLLPQPLGLLSSLSLFLSNLTTL